MPSGPCKACEAEIQDGQRQRRAAQARIKCFCAAHARVLAPSCWSAHCAKVKKVKQIYRQSDKGRQVQRKAAQKYGQSDKGRQVQQKAEQKYTALTGRTVSLGKATRENARNVKTREAQGYRLEDPVIVDFGHLEPGLQSELCALLEAARQELAAAYIQHIYQATRPHTLTHGR